MVMPSWARAASTWKPAWRSEMFCRYALATRSLRTGSLKTVHHWLRSSSSVRTRLSVASIQVWATGAGGRP